MENCAPKAAVIDGDPFMRGTGLWYCPPPPVEVCAENSRPLSSLALRNRYDFYRSGAKEPPTQEGCAARNSSEVEEFSGCCLSPSSPVVQYHTALTANTKTVLVLY